MMAVRISSICALLITALLIGCQRPTPPTPAAPPGPSVTIELLPATVSREGNEIVCVVKYRITKGEPEATDRYRVEWRDPTQGFAILAKVEGKDITPEGEFKARFKPQKPFGPELHSYQISIHQDYPGQKSGLVSNVVKGEV